MISESDFLTEYLEFGSGPFNETLETIYYTYDKRRNKNLYSREVLENEFHNGRFKLGMINIRFRGKIARSVLLTNYNNWCLVGRSISVLETIRSHLTYFLVPMLDNVILSNKLNGCLFSINPTKHGNGKKYLKGCFSPDSVLQIHDANEPYINFLTEKNNEFHKRIIADNKLYNFYYVPQYVGYYSNTNAVPNFLVEYNEPSSTK